MLLIHKSSVVIASLITTVPERINVRPHSIILRYHARQLTLYSATANQSHNSVHG